MAVNESLDAFQRMAYGPHQVIYDIYLFAKFLLIVEVCILDLISSCCRRFSCCRRSNMFVTIITKGYYLSQKFKVFFVKILFGPKEGIVERFSDTYKKDDVDNHGNTRLFLHGEEIGYTQMSVLSFLILIFALLAAVTACDHYFLDLSFICSEQPDVSCFPVAIYSPSDDLITYAQKHKITNCSYWTSEEWSGLVTFECFRWVYDSKGAISAVGGLLSLFLITMKILSSSLLACLSWMIKKCRHRSKQNKKRDLESGNSHPDDYSSVIKCYLIIRMIVTMVAAAIEFLFGGILLKFIAVAESGVNGKVVTFFYYHGCQLLLIFGIFSSLLLLPLELYATAGERRPSTTSPTERTPLLSSSQRARGGNQPVRPQSASERSCTTVIKHSTNKWQTRL